MGQKKLAPGIWDAGRGLKRIRVRGKDPRTGKLRERDRTVACTLREAKRIREEWHDEIVGGVEEPDPVPTLRTYATSWLDGKRKRVRWQSLEKYAGILDQHILPALGDIYLDALARRDIEAWVQAQAEQAKPRSVNARLAILKSILKEATNEFGLRNPSVLIRTLPTPDVNRPSMTPDQLRVLLEVIKTEAPGSYCLALMLALTGMRWGEATALKWSDIDREGRVIHVTKTLAKQRLGPTKSGKPRIVPLPEKLASELDKRRRWQVETQCPGLVDGWIWADRKGRPYRGNQWEVPLPRWCKAAGIPRMTPHSFRRTFVDLLRLAKVDAVVEHALVGHAGDVMREHYSTIRPDESNAAVEEAISLAVGGGSGGGTEKE